MPHIQIINLENFNPLLVGATTLLGGSLVGAIHGRAGFMVGGVTTAALFAMPYLPEFKVEGAGAVHMIWGAAIGWKFGGPIGAVIGGATMATGLLMPAAIAGIAGYAVNYYHPVDNYMVGNLMECGLGTASAAIGLLATHDNYALAGTAIGGLIGSIPGGIAGGVLGVAVDLYHHYA